jgi:hypothetical protein
MKQQKLTTKFLINTLDQFGLNPKEWSIKDQEHQRPLARHLVNKKDPSFQLLGQTDHKGWKRLHLLSL